MLKAFFLVVLFGGWLYNNSNYNQRYLIACLITLVSCIGLRHLVCYIDTIGYVQSYETLSNVSLSEISMYFKKDTGFYVISKIIQDIVGSSNYTIWFFFNAMAYVASLFFLLKRYSNDIMVSLIVYCALGFALFAMTGMRQNLALSCTMMALYFLLENNKRYFLLFSIVATFFHKTSGVFLVLYFVDLIPMNRKMLFFYIMMSAISIIFTQTILSKIVDIGIDERFEWYAEGGHQTLNYSGLIQQILFFVASYYMIGAKRNERTNKIFIIILLLGITFQAMSIFVAEMFRLSMYFSIVNTLFFANSLNEYCKSRRSTTLRTAALMVLSLYFITSKNNGFLRDYYFFWDEPPIEVYLNLAY